jgi:hypothetical protein
MLRTKRIIVQFIAQVNSVLTVNALATAQQNPSTNKKILNMIDTNSLIGKLVRDFDLKDNSPPELERGIKKSSF